MYGTEGLTIDYNGHCSREMPIRSGEGWPDFAELRRNLVRIRFASSLAVKLELPEEIEIGFSLTDEGFAELQRAVNWFSGNAVE